ncbi:hypothetical protein [Amycolatopsis rubida]|uniref:Holin n=1 Tax=Amycolatopsis rubida TaxID=112413 RepID=A0A1I5IFI1_9PSEU|nr:hypothetical protein [Amycolatopsis rubida]SFO59438.1 hypothetical protein SAMN05421854_102448 [Amycolatopsis rubida]
MTGQHADPIGAPSIGQRLADWAARFRKALAAVLAVAAVPGVLGLINLIPGVHLDAATFATIVAVVGALAGGGVVAAVPNKPAAPTPVVDPLYAEDVPRTPPAA